jgi:hypothetical protein
MSLDFALLISLLGMQKYIFQMEWYVFEELFFINQGLFMEILSYSIFSFYDIPFFGNAIKG